MKEKMTPKQRWLALFNHEKPDRIPTDYWATDEVTLRLLHDLSCKDEEELYQHLNIDAVVTIDPPCVHEHHPDDPEADIWGVKEKLIDYGEGTYIEHGSHPLADVTSVDEIHSYKWPDPDDIDYELFRKLLDDAPPYRIVRTGWFEPFLLYSAMRGMEQAMMDLLLEPEIAKAGLQHIYDYVYTINKRAFEIGQDRIDITYIAEDLGSQSSLLFGLKQIRDFFLPNQKRMADLARSFGIHIFYHSDGAIRKVIPDLINVTGIEVLNPIQWRCPTMERDQLVSEFGDKVIFHGAVDNQQTLSFGSTDDVRNEVLENIEIFKTARWICAPCHNIQPVTPTENVVAMYETINKYGKQ